MEDILNTQRELIKINELQQAPNDWDKNYLLPITEPVSGVATKETIEAFLEKFGLNSQMLSYKGDLPSGDLSDLYRASGIYSLTGYFTAGVYTNSPYQYGMATGAPPYLIVFKDPSRYTSRILLRTTNCTWERSNIQYSSIGCTWEMIAGVQPLDKSLPGFNIGNITQFGTYSIYLSGVTRNDLFTLGFPLGAVDYVNKAGTIVIRNIKSGEKRESRSENYFKQEISFIESRFYNGSLGDALWYRFRQVDMPMPNRTADGKVINNVTYSRWYKGIPSLANAAYNADTSEDNSLPGGTVNKAQLKLLRGVAEQAVKEDGALNFDGKLNITIDDTTYTVRLGTETKRFVNNSVISIGGVSYGNTANIVLSSQKLAISNLSQITLTANYNTQVGFTFSITDYQSVFGYMNAKALAKLNNASSYPIYANGIVRTNVGYTIMVIWKIENISETDITITCKSAFFDSIGAGETITIYPVTFVFA